MTLSEGISHLEETLRDPNLFSCQKCRDEHVQLWRWLVELQQYRTLLAALQSVHGDVSRKYAPGEVP